MGGGRCAGRGTAARRGSVRGNRGTEGERGSASYSTCLLFMIVYLQSRHSPTAGTDFVPGNLLHGVLEWVRACRDETMGCFLGLLDGLQTVFSTVGSIFRMSGKDQVPSRSEL